jgi:hypothetical protein
VANNSDHKKPFNDINKYLPEVYRSDVNRSVFDMAFNRHLTKDDTARVAGFIGTGNPQALVNRQIQESTPHRQAFQLAPTMFSTVGTVETALSFKAFQGQLELMGVDIDRIQKWGNTLQFNWAPPINLDLLINYQDYFWKPDNAKDAPQYFTIENRCNKAQSRVQAYANTLALRGSSFAITLILYATDKFVIANKLDDLFVPGFEFYTDTTANINLLNKHWTVASSTYNNATNETTIEVVESIASAGPTPPVAPVVGQWWYDATVPTLKEWNGLAWVLSVQAQTVNIDLTRLQTEYQIAANCACSGGYGWDSGPWDEDTNAQWDTSDDCDVQILNQWSAQNRWIHKSQVQSFSDVKRAQIPIIEYSSTVELNEWTKFTYSWKYRENIDQPFATTVVKPSRFELEPIKGYIVENISGVWYVFLFDQTSSVERDIDYTDTFVPGFRFRFTDNTMSAAVYTVASSEYRQVAATDPLTVTSVTGTGFFCTVVALQESTFTSQPQGGGVTHVRLEPLLTSSGDVWRGYHVHWLLDTTATTAVADTSSSANYFLATGLATPPSPQSVALLPVHFDDLQVFTPQVTAISISTAYQELVVDLAGVTRIDLVDQFRFSPTVPRFYGTPTSNEVRVYVDGIRQYANYTEVVGTGVPSYTLVGSVAQTTQTLPYVQAIVFNDPVEQFATVRIEVGPASQGDLGFSAVPVRTIEDEVAFTLATVAGTQPTYVPLTENHKLEQTKRAVNQYPLFNVYNIVTSEVVKASQTFGYRESSDAPINSAVGRRIMASSDSKDFEFEQYLLDRDNNLLYSYRNTLNVPDYWYSPLLNTVKFWDGLAWTEDILVTLASTAVAQRRVVISALPPAELLNVENGLWMDTTTNTLWKRGGIFTPAFVGTSWAVEAFANSPNMTINGTDPSLQTVWKHGMANQQYVPAYVDKDRNPITIGSPDGDWEVVDQWTFNPEHQNKQVIKFSQLITHFRTILQAQPSLPGLINGGVFTLTQNEIDYGLGGTIKEHNDSFDTLISAVNVTNVTPLGVIEFAEQEYASSLLNIRDLLNKSVSEVFGVYSQESLLDFNAYISNYVINRYEDNDFTAQIYGDTSAFDPVTGKGVRNWIATIPMFGHGPVYRPHLTVEGTAIRLFHHDGHRSTVQYSSVEADKLIRIICATPDPRTSGGTFGKVSSSAHPNTASALATAMGSFRVGTYWYRVSGGSRTFSRFMPYSIGGVAPSFLDTNGDEIPDGIHYYNTTDAATYEKSGLSWVPITLLGSGDITPLWVDIDLAAVAANVQLEVEQRLYEVTPVLAAVFDYTSLTPDAGEQAAYDKLQRVQFNKFIVDNGISSPFTNNEYTPSNAFTWNYVASVPLTPPRLDITPSGASSWQELYTRWYGTPYPHLEPWKLQGFGDKPAWWDEEYVDTTGARRWVYDHNTLTGMWENIRTGQVPAGQTYPNGAVSTGNAFVDGQTLPLYNYMSVNISNSTVPGGFGPDELLPPYYDNATVAGPLPTVRSLFTAFTSEIVAPDADYAFGDVGPAEWQWLVSKQRPYDFPTIAFLMQPARFLHSAFGTQYTLVDLLQVETTFNQVYSHEDALFHGDVFNTDQTYLVRGLNQWYVNFNRFSGFDTNGEFRQLWAGWDPKLTYQFAGIVDTSTFEIANKYFDIIGPDYQIILANNGVIKDLWVDAFSAGLLTIPPALVQYNNQAAWKIEVDSLAATARDIPYYGVKSYQVSANTGTDIFTAFSYPIVQAVAGSRRFAVVGDHTAEFTSGTRITVSGSTSNDGTYTVTSSVFETTANRTRVNVLEPVTASVADGALEVNRSIPWQTGDEVVISSSKFVPAPLLTNTPYYVIRLSGKQFQLAETPQDALAATPLDLTSLGDGVLHVSQVSSSFYVFGGAGNTQDLWFHYAIDKDDVRMFSPPYSVIGMQTFINLMDGYAAYQADSGVIQNTADSGDFDPDTGRLINWALETERFIDWAYGLRNSRVVVADKFPVTANIINDTFTFGAAVPMWLSGTAVVVTSSGDVPSPLVAGEVYYVVNTGTSGVIQLSTSSNPLDLASIVDITSAGLGQVMIGVFQRNHSFPQFELNPNRNNMWISTPLGVLSNVIAGPYSDIRVEQTIFDQYSRPVGADKLTVYREDKRSHIAVHAALPNDVDSNAVDDPYNYVHLGGAHLFVEGYEHFLIFNDYTVDGSLIYDPFLGLYSSKFDVDYFEKQEFTLRPTLGGFYLLDQQFHRNIEGSASDVRNFYDTIDLSETSDVARRSRALLGYKGRSQFLDFLNVNSKSQFLFYRGMVQTKGSVNSVNAYINSRRFVDAKLDEFWAWKIAEFGDSRVRVYPEIKLFSTDGAVDDVRLELLANSESETDDDVVAAVDKGFQLVSFKDEARWNLFPEQKSIIKSPLFLDAEVTSLTLIHSGTVPPPPGAELTINFWFDTDTQQLFTYNTGTGRWDIDVTAGNALVQNVVVGSNPATDYIYLRVKPCDDVRVIHRQLSSTSIVVTAATTTTFVLAGDRTSDVTVGVPFSITGSNNMDGTYYPTAVSYNGATTTVTVPVGAAPVAPFGVLAVQNFAQYVTELYNPGTGIKEVTKVDSEVVRFNLGGFQDVILLFTLAPAKEKLSPAKLIDVKSSTVVQQIPMWDPARGHHSHVAIHNVDLMHDGDPARYEFTPNPNDSQENFWNEQEVGTMWLDTAELGYLSYYDDKVYPDVNERLYNWGTLAPWADVKVYQWTRSTVPPAQWDAEVIAQAGDTSIAQNNKATGTPRQAVFKRVRTTAPATFAVDPVNTFTTTMTFTTGDQVLFIADNLPDGIESGVKYIVQTTLTPNVYTLTDPSTEDPVVITTAGVNVVVVPAFVATDWNTQSLIRDRIIAPYAVGHVLDEIGPMTVTWPLAVPLVLGSQRLFWTPSNPSAWVLTGAGADLVDIYVNGVLLESGLSIVDNLDGKYYVVLANPLTLNEYDIIDIVRPVHTITAAEAAFNPDAEDDGTTLIQWKTDYQYCLSTTTIGGTNVGSTTITYYYFWVQDSTDRNLSDSSSLSAFETRSQLVTIPTPYFVVQRPKDDPFLVEKYGYGMIEYGSIFSLGILTEADYQIPVLYREAIIRKVASYINDDDRYIVRFTRDWALRDDLTANGKQMNLKDKHEEWFMFRKEQTNTIPRELWDRMVESLVGFKLTDPSVRVPSLERELYDATYGSDTRFGLGVDQAFVDKTLGLSTVLSYLQNPANDFSPTDIDAFFAQQSFDTPAGIATAMDVIYNTFNASHVNSIWFETLLDAFSTRAKYKELMKTSWIALHGIRVLEVGGLFDD